MTPVTNAIEGYRNGFENGFAAGKFGWSTAGAGREGVATWIHSMTFSEFYLVRIELYKTARYPRRPSNAAAP